MRGYTHLSVLRHFTLPYTVIDVIMHHGTWLYVYFYIKGVGIRRFPYSGTHTSPCGYTYVYTTSCVVIH